MMITLDRPIVWQRATSSKDLYGQVDETWSTIKTVWAKRMAAVGFENYEAEQKVAVSNVRYVVRWDDSWLATDRIVDEGEIFEITSVQEYQSTAKGAPTTRRHYMLLTCNTRDSINTGRDN